MVSLCTVQVGIHSQPYQLPAWCDLGPVAAEAGEGVTGRPGPWDFFPRGPAREVGETCFQLRGEEPVVLNLPPQLLVPCMKHIKVALEMQIK